MNTKTINKLSVYIITLNEEQNIRRCLESVKFADEIIVVDSGSHDKTQEICKEYTDKIFHQDWLGFGMQKQLALDKTSNDWVFNIDADEEVSPKLAAKMQQILDTPKFQAYKIIRHLILFNQVLKHGAAKNDPMRFFNKQYGKYKTSTIHEGINLQVKPGLITEPLLHYSFNSLDDLISTMNKYTSLQADSKRKANKKSSLSKALTHAIWTFIRIYFIKLGFLDGRLGFIMTISYVEGCYYRYLKTKYHGSS